jgi:uncharacterized membrane protein
VEDAAIGVTQFLVRLIFPFAILGTLLGLGLMAHEIVTFARYSGDRSGSAARSERAKVVASEKISVGICATLGILGLIALIINSTRRNLPLSWWSALLVVLLILLGTPAMLWKSRWRVFMEGVATVTLAGVSVLTGFSIGFVFVPLLAVMIWVSLRHVLLASGLSLPGAARRVDSPP